MEVEKTVGQAKVEEEPEEGSDHWAKPGGSEAFKFTLDFPFPFRNHIISAFFVCHTVSLLYEFPFLSNADPLDQTPACQIFQPDPLCSFGVVSSADESSEGDEARVTMKEEYVVDWAWSLVEVGGASSGRGGGTGVVESGISLCLVLLSLSGCSLTVLWLCLAFVTDPFSLF